MPSLNELYYSDPFGSQYEPQPRQSQSYAPVAQAIPENKTLRRLSDFAGNLKDYANQYYVKDWVPILGGTKAGDFFLGQTPEEIGRWAEGNSPFVEARGVNRAAIPTPTFKTGRRDAVYDVAFNALDVAGLSSTAARLGERAAPYIAKGSKVALNEIGNAAQGMAHTNLYGVPQPIANMGTPSGMRNPEGGNWGGPLYAVKPEGGNFVAGEPKNYAKNFRKDVRLGDVLDEWLLQHPEIDHNDLADTANYIIGDRRAEVYNSLSSREQGLLSDYYDARQKYQDIEGGWNEIDDADEAYEAMHNLENEIIRTVNIPFNDRAALMSDDFGDVGDAYDYYQKLAADEIAKEKGIPTVEEHLLKKDIPAAWNQSVLTDFIGKKMATPSDPLRKAIDEGRYQPANPPEALYSKELAELYEHRLENQSEFTKIGKEPPGTENLASTPAGIRYEEATDRDMRYTTLRDLASGETEDVFGEFHKSDYPWIKENTSQDTKFYRPVGWSGSNKYLSEIAKESRMLADEGRMTLDNLKKWSVDQVAAEATNRRLAEEKLQGQSKELIDKWAQERYETLPTAMEFTDGDKVAVFSKETTSNPELLKRDLSLQTCILNHCVGSASMNQGKYYPMVEPHTGKVPAKAQPGHGAGYYSGVLDGTTEIHSIVNNKGLPQVTMEFLPRRYEKIEGKGGAYSVSQIQGEENGPIPEQYRQKVAQYLSENEPRIEDVDSEELHKNGLFSYNDAESSDNAGRVYPELKEFILANIKKAKEMGMNSKFSAKDATRRDGLAPMNIAFEMQRNGKDYFTEQDVLDYMASLKDYIPKIVKK